MLEENDPIDGARIIRDCLIYLGREARMRGLSELARMIDIAELAARDACRGDPGVSQILPPHVPFRVSGRPMLRLVKTGVD